MASEVVQITRRGFGQTMRRDAWWVQPLVVFIILASLSDRVVARFPLGERIVNPAPAPDA